MILVGLIVLPLLAISLFIFYINNKLNYWNVRGIPHNKPRFLLGNAEERHWSVVFREMYDKFKGTGLFAGYYLFALRGAVILEPEIVKDILIKDFHSFEDRGLFYNERDDPLTANLFFLDGEKWRKLRQKFTPTFTSGKMKQMFKLITKTGQELNVVMKEKVGNNDGIVMEFTSMMGRFTSDVIGMCAFGLDCNGLRNPEAEFVVMGKKFFTEPRHGQILSAFIMIFPQMAKKLGIKLIRDDVHNFYTKLVRDTIRYREENQMRRNDFMDILIDLRNEMAETGEVLTLNEIAAQAFVFLIAGFETSATTLSFILYELAQNEEVQEKLRKEIKEIFAKYNNELTYESMSEMKYLDCVVNETMRKNPIVSQILRKTRARYETSDPRYYIDANTYIFIPVIGLHYDPAFYPDPEKFIPERFLPEQIQKRPACTFLPFGDGPRNCIGARFAKMQIFVGLSYLISDFKFSVCPETEIPYKPSYLSFTITPANGIHLKVERI